MRVKEKSHPPVNGIEASVSVSPRRHSPVKISVKDGEIDQVLDLSKSCNKVNGHSGTSEPDAIHRRLTSSDCEINTLAQSVMESLDKSPNRKRKRSTPKKSPSKLEVDSGTNMVLSTNIADECKLPITEIPLSEEVKVEPSDLVKSDELDKNDTQKVEVSLTNENKASIHISTGKGKKKPVTQGKKTTKKKKPLKKKGFQNDEDHLEIDPRLGGSKIKDALKNKGKDKKQKHSDTEAKKPKNLDRYPYLHIEGPWNQPHIVKIINGHIKEDDNEGKHVAKVTRAAQYVDEEHRNKAAKVGFTSTLSDRYDTHNRDVSWICVFCQQYTHMQCLGDLYGPYYVNQVCPEPAWHSRRHPDSTDSIAASESSLSRSPIKKSKKSPKKKFGVKTEQKDPSSPTNSQQQSTPISMPVENSEEKKEVWFHESCVIWAPGVCLVPPRLMGLDEAIADSQESMCMYCEKRGAHIFCRRRGCGARSHFPCAAAKHWLLLEDKFLALCCSHKDIPV